MAKYIICKSCGQPVDKHAKICMFCGARVHRPIYKKWWFWVLSVFIVGMLAPSSHPEQSDIPPVKSESPEIDQQSEPYLNRAEQWAEHYANRGIDVLKVPADVLYEYSPAYYEQTVCTGIQISSKTPDMLKAGTSNNDSFAFSIVAEFGNSDEIKSLSEGDWVVIVGKVQTNDIGGFLGTENTVTMENCHVISEKDNYSTLANEIENERAIQLDYAAAGVEKIENDVAAQVETEKQDYIAICQQVPYHDVERNPSQYEDMDISVSGSVAQVSEGLFDSVTLRVDSAGNYWYITYMRKSDSESRILEGDSIVAYGKCTGVETYTSVLGTSNTIPSMSAQYIDIN